MSLLITYNVCFSDFLPIEIYVINTICHLVHIYCNFSYFFFSLEYLSLPYGVMSVAEDHVTSTCRCTHMYPYTGAFTAKCAKNYCVIIMCFFNAF